MTVHTFVKGANTAAHLRSPTRRKLVERSPDTGSDAGEQVMPLVAGEDIEPGRIVRKIQLAGQVRIERDHIRLRQGARRLFGKKAGRQPRKRSGADHLSKVVHRQINL